MSSRKMDEISRVNVKRVTYLYANSRGKTFSPMSIMKIRDEVTSKES